MIPLYTQKQFNDAKSSDMLPCKCVKCNTIFYKQKRTIKQALMNKGNHTGDYCSIKCSNKTIIKVICSNCNIEFLKTPSQILKSKSGRLFCSQSCSASYNNKNKTHGTRRSKLEIWLEEQLTRLYQNLEIHYNQKSAIQSELDIYIPSLNLAFELNGIFHYEPIYGLDKLNQIQENDISKSKACHDAKIDLCVIDVSQLKHFKVDRALKYLCIITNIINQRTC